MSLITKQKENHSHRKQTYSYQMGVGEEQIRRLGFTCNSTTYRTDNQQLPLT